MLSNYKDFPATACYTNVNSSKCSRFCLSRTLAQAHDAPPKAKEAQMLLLLTLKSGESPWTYRGAPRSKPSPAHVCHAVESGAGRHTAASYCALAGVPATTPARSLQLSVASQASITLSSWPKTHSGMNHSGIFITSFNTRWLWASLSSSCLTVPDLVVSVSQQGKMCPALQ